MQRRCLTTILSNTFREHPSLVGVMFALSQMYLTDEQGGS